MSLAVASLEFTQSLAAPIERAFAALTEGPHLERWFCDACESAARPGGALIMHWRGAGASPLAFVARWTRFEPPAHCSYRGGHAGYPGGDASLVDLTLAPLAEGARLTVCHALPDMPEYEPFAATFRTAWPRALARLAAYLTPSPEDALRS